MSKSIESVIKAAGDFAHGGDLEASVREWEAAGFSADTAEEWVAAECFCARSARRLADAGLTPDDASAPAPQSVGYEGASIGYAVSNGDLSVAEACVVARAS